ncbi:hypothetical protein CLU79DRAFT_761758 [Phycomyces nitens]|nr:hypothetical protein CLU79DRAFT_761758 [Phycomyces nitens]
MARPHTPPPQRVRKQACISKEHLVASFEKVNQTARPGNMRSNVRVRSSSTFSTSTSSPRSTDNVAIDAHPLAFPYHNDTIFLPTVESGRTRFDSISTASSLQISRTPSPALSTSSSSSADSFTSNTDSSPCSKHALVDNENITSKCEACNQTKADRRVKKRDTRIGSFFNKIDLFSNARTPDFAVPDSPATCQPNHPCKQSTFPAGLSPESLTRPTRKESRSSFNNYAPSSFSYSRTPPPSKSYISFSSFNIPESSRQLCIRFLKRFMPSKSS